MYTWQKVRTTLSPKGTGISALKGFEDVVLFAYPYEEGFKLPR